MNSYLELATMGMKSAYKWNGGWSSPSGNLQLGQRPYSPLSCLNKEQGSMWKHNPRREEQPEKGPEVPPVHGEGAYSS